MQQRRIVQPQLAQDGPRTAADEPSDTGLVEMPGDAVHRCPHVIGQQQAATLALLFNSGGQSAGDQRGTLREKLSVKLVEYALACALIGKSQVADALKRKGQSGDEAIVGVIGF